VPAYFHPAVAAREWAVLAKADVLSAVVLNVDSGPGHAREAELAAVAAAVPVPVLGYVDTAYGQRSVASVAADLRNHRRWYGVEGFFLDQAAIEPAFVRWYREVITLAGDVPVVLNHGTYPDAGYAGLGAALVTFEGSADAYRRVVPPAWALRRPAADFWHIVYATPEPELDAVLARAARCNAGTVYVTDRGGANPWDGLPWYLDRLLAGWLGET
jgi:hypothetical protein